jgi:hypothetical protein
MEFAFQIVVGCILLVAFPIICFGIVFALPGAGSISRSSLALMIGVPLLWVLAVAAWLYWLGGWHAVWVIAGLLLLGPYVRGRSRRASQDRGSRTIPAPPSPEVRNRAP